eukprot:scaffold55420_cov33-Prasinocladus_malaysianus.AAC.1
MALMMYVFVPIICVEAADMTCSWLESKHRAVGASHTCNRKLCHRQETRLYNSFRSVMNYPGAAVVRACSQLLEQV